ncbi:MAG: hypothetical protein V4525_10980 [Pseudomonadota bacterium]
MAATIRERIFQQIETSLNGIAGIVTLERERPEPFSREECPAINIEPVSDIPQQVTVPRTSWNLSINIQLQLRDEEQSSAADPFIAEIHSRLMADHSLGGLAVDINAGEVHFSRFDGDATVCLIDMNFVVEYQTSANDLTV